MASAKKTSVAAHDQTLRHVYVMHYPPHPARTSDPHYKDFNHIHRAQRATARCYVGQRVGFHECRDAQGNPAPAPRSGEQPGLEMHHTHVEFALQNGVDLAALEVDYPGISDPDSIGAWVESADNMRWLCAWHHRGIAGIHAVAHADFEASCYVPGLIGVAPEATPRSAGGASRSTRRRAGRRTG